MLPNPHDQPSGLCESRIGVRVATTVRLDLLAPEISILGRPGRMLGTAMPEAAVHEDRYACRSEDDVGSTAFVGQERPVHPVSQASGVQYPPQL